MLQHEVYNPDNWMWVSPLMWQFMNFTHVPCTAPCTARWCLNFQPTAEMHHIATGQPADYTFLGVLVGAVVLAIAIGIWRCSITRIYAPHKPFTKIAYKPIIT